MNTRTLAALMLAASALAACSNNASTSDTRTGRSTTGNTSTGSPLVTAPSGGVTSPSYGTSGESMPQGQNMETNTETPSGRAVNPGM
jgi:hypothetical protein